MSGQGTRPGMHSGRVWKQMESRRRGSLSQVYDQPIYARADRVGGIAPVGADNAPTPRGFENHSTEDHPFQQVTCPSPGKHTRRQSFPKVSDKGSVVQVYGSSVRLVEGPWQVFYPHGPIRLLLHTLYTSILCSVPDTIPSCLFGGSCTDAPTGSTPMPREKFLLVWAARHPHWSPVLGTTESCLQPSDIHQRISETKTKPKNYQPLYHPCPDE